MAALSSDYSLLGGSQRRLLGDCELVQKHSARRILRKLSEGFQKIEMSKLFQKIEQDMFQEIEQIFHPPFARLCLCILFSVGISLR